MVRLALLAAGVAFGLLLLVGVSLPTAPVAVPAGLAVALIVQWVTRLALRTRFSSEDYPLSGATHRR
jgi:hypothetical protein